MKSNMIAKLLAKENISVEVGNHETAFFDTKSRVLGLPDWSDKDLNVYNLLVGHEVGHALFTPFDGLDSEKARSLPKGFINVVEDNRIERKIQTEYPGLINKMSKGYNVLYNDGFFGELTNNVDKSKLSLIDKINLISKIGRHISIDLDDVETELFNEVNTSKTFDDVLEVCQKIVDYSKEQEEKEKEEKQPEPDKGEQDSEGSDSNDDTSTESDDSNGSGNSGDDDSTADNDYEADDSICSSDNDKREETDDVKDSVAEVNDSITDAIFNEKIKSLNESDGSRIKLLRKPSKAQIDHAVTPFKEYNEKTTGYDKYIKLLTPAFNSRIKDIKKAIQPAVREFEQNKAAFEWKNAQRSTKGIIDPNKLHTYKFAEDLLERY